MTCQGNYNVFKFCLKNVYERKEEKTNKQNNNNKQQQQKLQIDTQLSISDTALSETNPEPSHCLKLILSPVTV